MSLKVKRLEKELSQKALGKISGVSQSMINDIESGKKSPSVTTLSKLARALECNLVDLIDEKMTLPKPLRFRQVL